MTFAAIEPGLAIAQRMAVMTAATADLQMRRTVGVKVLAFFIVAVDAIAGNLSDLTGISPSRRNGQQYLV